jgi:ribosomal protein S18 acetylase RimI-like enzyme
VDDTALDERGKDNEKLATFLIDLSPSDMQRRLGDALAVYVDAMRYPRGTEDQRASMWLEHTRRHGWKAVAAVEVPDQYDVTDSSAAAMAAAPMLGVAPTATAAHQISGGSSRWCRGLHRVGADRVRIAELMTSYFELTELHIAPRAQGRGLGEALARRLLADRGEAHVLLSTPEINRRSQQGVATVSTARVHRHHPRLPLRRRSARLRDPGPGTATVRPRGLAR